MALACSGLAWLHAALDPLDPEASSAQDVCNYTRLFRLYSFPQLCVKTFVFLTKCRFAALPLFLPPTLALFDIMMLMYVCMVFSIGCFYMNKKRTIRVERESGSLHGRSFTLP